MNFFCMVGDHHVAQALALHLSLEGLCKYDFHLFVFAEPYAYGILNDCQLYETTLMLTEDFIDDELNGVRDTRSKAEFAWTCRPKFIQYCFSEWAISEITCVDADVLFFYDPLAIYDNITSDIAITPHRFPARMKWREDKNGLFNAGWFYLRRSDRASACLEEWRQQCLDWCSLEYESPDRKCVDQGYMDAWPKKYGAQQITHPGINLAPWNQEQYDYGLRDNILMIERLLPVHMYHFHGFRPENWSSYPLKEQVKKYIYGPYLNFLQNAWDTYALGLTDS